ncbi:PAAR domain-containing protein [Saccharothrix longispora]|uniref:Zn-binding protein involved in type VI secretion n=1 Tax=Saccharothrix longispora TaxID=33920 RepID=A0ABU1PMM2_9PSEU|nr:PAAR domain-containing protein [Saccharothrix longispora]MBY8850246.1 PAAR domain-containing protein [Saccharothrix sp. MB29]MDR6591912.1 putative Zn-binding protein involved in type VI secretion [Saccharothrix longispora]MDU0290339.1 PAAR domain-containing protein [Saccharothrix longispora]
MPPAARSGDQTSHGGALGPPPPPAAVRVATVLIEGRPAAVVGGVHGCPVPPHAALGPANLVVPGPGSLGPPVLVGGLPAARVGDRTSCGANVLLGALTVRIGG